MQIVQCFSFPWIIGFVQILSLFSGRYYGESESTGQSLYDLLGVAKDADLVEIRRNFKKLAIKFHPDKNKDDPRAHDKFVRINRAYEVLKDDDLHKKYDARGEEGLRDGAPFGQNYQSWRFYKEQFGIYDDDPEIITLTSGDFEALVSTSGQRWFVNFYSAQCSHCHHLAPEWRKMARAAEGAFRIGAVNCLDDFNLCSSENIRSYPSLMLYPERLRYDGPRDSDSLLDFLLTKANPTPWVELGPRSEVYRSVQQRPSPWLVEFRNGPVQGRGDLSERTRSLLSVSFGSMVNRAFVDCRKEPEWCGQLGFSSELVYFSSGENLEKSVGLKIDSLDSKEISAQLLSLLPNFPELTIDEMNDALKGTENIQRKPRLVEFIVGDESHSSREIRKLPILLKEFNSEVAIGRFNCSKRVDFCSNNLRINKFPTFALFKKGGGFEFHYGRNSVFDVANFVKAAAVTNVRSLGPDHFPEMVIQGGRPWMVDFFAPWCPPCMKMLPEFRKAAGHLGDEAQFGTVDYAAEPELCTRLRVSSYPTTVFYNDSNIHTLVGYHSVQELLDFLHDTKNPPVETLTPESLELDVIDRASGVLWVVDFYDPNCPPCRQLEPEFRKLAKSMSEYDFVHFGKMDCSQFGGLCARSNVRHYPTVRLFPLGSESYADYQNWFRDAASMQRWVLSWLPSLVTEIHGRYFSEDVLTSPQPFLVDFFAPWCGPCHFFAPEYEKVARALRDRVAVVKMNCDLNPGACSSARVTGYPMVKFYAGSEDGKKQSPLGWTLNGRTSREIIASVENLLKRGSGPGRGAHDEL